MPGLSYPEREVTREFFIHNLLVRIHLIIVMIRWNGLAPWELDTVDGVSDTAEIVFDTIDGVSDTAENVLDTADGASDTAGSVLDTRAIVSNRVLDSVDGSRTQLKVC